MVDYARVAGIHFSIEALASGNARFGFSGDMLSLELLDVVQTWLKIYLGGPAGTDIGILRSVHF